MTFLAKKKKKRLECSKRPFKRSCKAGDVYKLIIIDSMCCLYMYIRRQITLMVSGQVDESQCSVGMSYSSIQDNIKLCLEKCHVRLELHTVNWFVFNKSKYRIYFFYFFSPLWYNSIMLGAQYWSFSCLSQFLLSNRTAVSESQWFGNYFQFEESTQEFSVILFCFAGNWRYSLTHTLLIIAWISL